MRIPIDPLCVVLLGESARPRPAALPVMLSHQRARLIASECPLTWRQVTECAYEASSSGSLLLLSGGWLEGGPVEEVAEWLWQYWVDRETDGPESTTGPILDFGPELSVASTPDPASVSTAAQKPQMARSYPDVSPCSPVSE